MADRVLITGTASQEVKEGVLHSLQSHGYDAAIEDNAETINAAVAAPIVKGRRPALVMCVEEANCAATEGDDYSPNDDSSPQAFAKGDAASSANYHRRYFWRPGSSTVDEVVKMVDNAAAPPSLHRFTSTRGSAEGATFLLVVREGLARDGGLYVLKDLPTLAPSQLEHILYGSNANGGDLDYVDVAQVVMEYLVDDSITPPQLRPLLVEAYNRTRWSNLENLCPLTPLLCGQRSGRNPNNWPLFSSDDVHVLELFHGPTAAFKDFALQLFPRCFEVAVENDFQTRRQANAAEEKEAYLVLAATSGDTGVAAISGFVESAGSSQVMVLYPKSGVSPVQQIQMLSLDDGKKVRVFGVDGDFDFCQSSVKAIFKNTDLTAQLASQKPPRRLSSANSINWGRLVPQVVYYFWAYRQLVHRGAAVGSREVSPSASAADFDLQSSTRRMDVVIPCGNFGNLLAAYIARRMGLPIRRLIVASNSNDVLCDFIQTGVYDIADRGLLKTASPSIDILKASNIERFLFYLSEGNTELVSRLMLLLDQDQYFKLPEELHKKMSLYMWAGRCSEAECAQTIADVYEASGCTRLLDPHTAVAACVANAYLTSQAEATRRGEKEDCALLIASTAHWSKFPQPVLNAILHHGESSNDATGAGLSSALPAAQVRQLYANVLDTAKSAKAGTSTIAVHKALLDALTASESLKNPPRELNASLDEVVAQVSAFCSSTL